MTESGDYISREAVEQIIAAQCGECADACLEFDGIQPDCNQCLLSCAKKAIESIPAADVRPVVFCKNCRNSHEWANMDGDNYRYCSYLRSRWNHDTDRMVDDDDFCKWGVKREES